MIKKILGFILTIILTASICYGADLQSFYKQKWLGINPRVSPKLLTDDEASDASNFNLNESGAITERDIFGQYNSLPGALGFNSITGLFKYYTTTSKFFVACAGSKIASGSSGTWTDITNASISITSGSFWSASTFNNNLYLFNPSVVMQKWTGTGITTNGGAATVPGTNCAYGAVHKARLWAARSDSLPYRIYFSSLNNGEDWTTTGGTADLPDLTQTITGLISWGGYLFAFTETGIYRINGSTPNDFSLTKTNSQVGAIAPRSIKVTDIGIVFLSRTGLFAFDGNNSNKLSDKIEPLINNISKTLIGNASAIYDGQGKYWLSYTDKTSSFNNKILIYDTILKEWYPYDNLNINYFCKADGGSDKGELYGGSATNNGIVYSLQSAVGTESITHSTKAQFDNNVTFNTVSTTTPSVILKLIPQDSYTKLLLHFNGTNGSTTITDSSPVPKSTTGVNGNAQISTTQSEFGISSLSLDGAGDSVDYADSDDWNLGAGDFTIDCWIRMADLSANMVICGQYDGLANAQLLYWSATNGIAFYNYDGAFKVNLSQGATTGWAINTWYHVAMVRSGNDYTLYRNGTSVATTNNANAMTDIAAGFYLSQRGSAGDQYFNGYIDEFRWSKGIARWTANFTPPTKEYTNYVGGGTDTSVPIQINASGTSALSTIDFLSTLPTNTKVTFQTRTGLTNDTVYFNGWQRWTTANTVNFERITNNTVWRFSDKINFYLTNPGTQTRDILYYEDDDNVSPNSIAFYSTGAGATGKYAEETIPIKDLSSYDWITGWYKSPEIGQKVAFSFGANSSQLNTTTFNTVNVNTWEPFYWYIGGISAASRNTVSIARLTYMGTTAGNVILGESKANNYYSNGDVMTSTPNDWIEYRAIFGTNDDTVTPELNSVTLTYSPQSAGSESTLSSYYYTKWFDFGTPQINKQFSEILLDVNVPSAATTSSTVVYCDYDIDNGTKTGTISFPVTVTSNTVKIRKYFSGSTFGKTMRLKIYNNDLHSTPTIQGVEIRYRPENLNN